MNAFPLLAPNKASLRAWGGVWPLAFFLGVDAVLREYGFVFARVSSERFVVWRRACDNQTSVEVSLSSLAFSSAGGTFSTAVFCESEFVANVERQARVNDCSSDPLLRPTTYPSSVCVLALLMESARDGRLPGTPIRLIRVNHEEPMAAVKEWESVFVSTALPHIQKISTLNGVLDALNDLRLSPERDIRGGPLGSVDVDLYYALLLYQAHRVDEYKGFVTGLDMEARSPLRQCYFRRITEYLSGLNEAEFKVPAAN